MGFSLFSFYNCILPQEIRPLLIGGCLQMHPVSGKLLA